MANSSSKEQECNNKGSVNPIKKALLIFVGSISLGLACIGIFLPVLPTTPFLLLSAACYCKSSQRLHKWLLNHKLFGKYIKNYMEGKGISLRTKLFAIALMWASICFAAFVAVPVLIIQVILFIIAIAVTVHILKLPTFKK
ncbi:MAG: YbaN family protein [Candidatus Bathyarchaeia archaeon]